MDDGIVLPPDRVATPVLRCRISPNLFGGAPYVSAALRFERKRVRGRMIASSQRHFTRLKQNIWRKFVNVRTS